MTVATTTVVLHDNALAAIALRKGLPGASKAQLMKYALLLFIGKTEEEARNEVFGLSTDPASLSQSNKVSVWVDPELLNQAVQRTPGIDNMSYRWRLMVALAAGFTEEQVKGIIELERGCRSHKKNREHQ